MVTYLHLNIQYTNAPFLRYILDRLHTRPIIIAPELCMLDERAFVNDFGKRVFAREIVFDAVSFAGAGGASRVCIYINQFFWINW